MSSPTLTSVTIVSNNTIKTNYAGTDDEATLSITASENINQPTVVFTSNSQSINNTSVTYSGSNTSWTAKYTVHSSDSNGAVGFTINFQSTGGTSGTEVSATTDSSSVIKVNSEIVTNVTNNSNPLQLGNNIEGAANFDYLGKNQNSISLSNDGNIIALGSEYHSATVYTTGHVRIYQRDATNNSVEPHGWTQLGLDIDGGNNQRIGYSLSLIHI